MALYDRLHCNLIPKSMHACEEESGGVLCAELHCDFAAYKEGKGVHLEGGTGLLRVLGQ